MVGFDRVTDLGLLLQTTSDLGADDRVRALDLVRHGLTDIVQERTTPGELNVGTQLGGDDAGNVGRFDDVLEHVLPVRGSVLEPAEDPDELGVHVGDPGLEHGPFATLADLALDGLDRLGMDVLDPGRLDAPVQDQLLEREACLLSPDRVEARQHHGLRGVVDDQVGAGHGLERPDVAAFTTDDATLHVLVGERHGLDRRFGGQLRSDPLHRDRGDLAGTLVALFPGLGLDVTNENHRVTFGLILDLIDQDRLGILGRQAGDALELRSGSLLELIDLGVAASQRLLPLLDRLILAVEGVGPRIQALLALGEPVLLLLAL